jgi:hypothetical protein
MIEMVSTTPIDSKDIYKETYTINQKKHNLYLIHGLKKALTCFDDKRFICKDGTHTFPFGIRSVADTGP